MTGCVAQIWRHPIKAHGREQLDSVPLTKGQTMPWDRTWAVAHEMAKTDGQNWVRCVNFSRAAKAPSLQAITARLNEDTCVVTLTHPDLQTLQFNPDTEAEAFLDWVAPIMPADRAASVKIIRVKDQGMTDSDYPTLSLNNLASNAEIGKTVGQDLSPTRWRGNIWFDGLPAWDEVTWIGKTIRIGTAELFVQESITRCLATTVNPETGNRDADTLAALAKCGQDQKFGVYGVVTKSGIASLGDRVEVLT
ncbi:MAG: MOSC domain-containing protein [Marinosulfonomonas sp.]